MDLIQVFVANVQKSAAWIPSLAASLPKNSCDRLWDPERARFEDCALPYVAAVPAFLSGLVLFCIILLKTPTGKKISRILTTFNAEIFDKSDIRLEGLKTFHNNLTLLAAVAILGIGLQTLVSGFDTTALHLPATWVFILSFVLIERPGEASIPLFFLFFAIFSTQAAVQFQDVTSLAEVYEISCQLPTALLAVAFAGMIVVTRMPMRHPLRHIRKISKLFSDSHANDVSPEDNLTLWQYMSVSWMKPLMMRGTERQLNEEDVWSLGREFQHSGLHEEFSKLKGSVPRKVLIANGLDLALITLFTMIGLISNFSGPVLLQKILYSMSGKTRNERAALVYTILTLLSRLISTQFSVFESWYGRRAFERCRGQLITMTYQKTLRRKVVNDVIPPSELQSEVVIEPEVLPAPTFLNKIINLIMWPFRRHQQSSKTAQKLKKPRGAASAGKIINIIRSDAYEIAQRLWDFNSFIQIPVSLIFSVVLIWDLIGWPCLLGAATIFIGQMLNSFVARILLRWERDRRRASDDKVDKIAQLVDTIRHLRYYGWQNIWLKNIIDAREHELSIRIITSCWGMVISFINIMASGMFPVTAFYAYTVLAGRPLSVDVAFPALQLFSSLEQSIKRVPDLISTILNTKVSTDRLTDYMNEPDRDGLTRTVDISQAPYIEMKEAEFSWPGYSVPVISDISVRLSTGLTVIYGEVGSGKTAFLLAMLGELDHTGGFYSRSSDMIGYCAQTAWLQSMSIRDNIIFSSLYDESRYKSVLKACQLVPDMLSFKHGDLSLIGENGIGLSGGQRSRVALARALYSNSRVIYLDDPLSALDHQTANSIVHECLLGPLVKDRMVILSTHRTDLVFPYADQALLVQNGTVKKIETSTLFNPGDQYLPTDDSSTTTMDKEKDELMSLAVPDKFLTDEHREHGGVKYKVYWTYFRAGSTILWLILFSALVACRLLDVGETWFLKSWGEGYDKQELGTKSFFNNPLERLPNPSVDIKPWLIGFFVLTVLQAVFSVVTQMIKLTVIYQAGRNLFVRIMSHVTSATFRYYDVTPVGRLMNRMTADINIIDGDLSNKFQSVAMNAIVWTTSVIIIASVTPAFLVFAITLTIAFTIIFLQFLPTSQSLRRLEMASLTPLVSNFGALAEGLITIRAYCVENKFQAQVVSVVDNFQKMDHFYWSLNMWLSYRYGILSASSTFIITIMALKSGVSAGLTAFLLDSASRFVGATNGLCREYGTLQMEFVSVERVIELLDIEQENPGSHKPPAYWPSYKGDIVFENVTLRYAPHLEPALKNASITIPGGSTTALIGRTGSGKSTLALSLLSTIPPSEGRILIDNIDISIVDKQVLRHRITFLAQDPVLFPGTMRQNLDPISEYSDAECTAVLNDIVAKHKWTLDMHIESGGKNLSQGQRQLVGLARALLRRSPIIIMDEATASIDMETAMFVQEVLKEKMKESTVIIIAHRVEAVKNANFCVVLADGEILKSGSPAELTENMLG